MVSLSIPEGTVCIALRAHLILPAAAAQMRASTLSAVCRRSTRTCGMALDPHIKLLKLWRYWQVLKKQHLQNVIEVTCTPASSAQCGAPALALAGRSAHQGTSKHDLHALAWVIRSCMPGRQTRICSESCTCGFQSVSYIITVSAACAHAHSSLSPHASSSKSLRQAPEGMHAGQGLRA